MNLTSVDRNLLFGLLALQNDFITRDDLLAAFASWLTDKSRRLEDILSDRGVLAPALRDLLRSLVEEHVKRHNNDARASLIAVGDVAGVRQALGQLGDDEVKKSLQQDAREEPGPKAGPKTDPELARQAAPPKPRFKVLRPHAEGGLGQVSVALDEELHREVAFKEIKEEYADEDQFRARFVLEAEITGGLEHPGIVPVYGLGCHQDGRPHYAMRFIRGETLEAAIERFHAAKGTVPPAAPGQVETARQAASPYQTTEFRQLLGRFVAVCHAIEYAHSRVVLHRDLKPNNIMLGRYGETLVVDWGLAKAAATEGKSFANPDPQAEPPLMPASGGSSVPTLLGSTIGTPAYASPEQAAGRLEQLGPASDVYCLGATLYHLIAGRPPITDTQRDVAIQKAKRGDFPALRTLVPSAPKGLVDICEKAMAHKPQDRYATASLLRERIEFYLENEPLSLLYETIVELRGLSQNYPERSEYRERLARELVTFSKVLQALHREEEAVTYAQEGVEILFEEFAASQASIRLFADLYHARVQLALLLRSLRESERAQAVEDANTTSMREVISRMPRTRETRDEILSATLHAGFDEKRLEEMLADADSADLGSIERREFLSTTHQLPEHSSDALPAASELLSNRYEIIQMLGQGAAARIYHAKDRLLHRDVAIKFQRAEFTDRDMDLLLAEGLMLGALHHEHIVPIYDIGQFRERQGSFLVLKHITGETWARRAPTADADLVLELPSILDGFVHICDALHYAHSRGIVHCDPKPSNVLVDENGPWIVDWGLGAVFDPARCPLNDLDTESFQIVSRERFGDRLFGTPAFMSPEQAEGRSDLISPTTDVYVLGATLYFLLVGESPHYLPAGGRTLEMLRSAISGAIRPPREINSRVPKKLSAVCMKALAKPQSERFQSCEEFGDAVRRAI